LFQERFKSEAVDDDSYLLTTLRYIHQNPVKAGISRYVQEYKWSSYYEYIEKSIITDVEFPLSIISDNRERAIGTFIEYTNEKTADRCIDYDEKIRVPDDVIKEYITDLSIDSTSELQQLDINKRNTILRKIKETDGITIRQLARITGISKSVIDRL
jgi:hypothetical protein